MKYYSDTLRKAFDTEQECLSAEKEYEDRIAAEKAKQEALNKTRKDRAKEVEDAYKKLVDAQKSYNDICRKFMADYGSWHMTISSVGELDSFIDSIFRVF